MIDQKVVEKPGKLTASEFVDIQKHPIYSLHAIKDMRGLPYVSRFVAYQMHERADSTGYPGHRPKNLIHTYAQIAAVADVYDAMINVRPWRPAYHPYQAMEMLIAESSTGKFDAGIVRSFLHAISLYPVGCCVTLDSGEIARVVHSNGKSIDRPVVAVLIGADGRELPRPEFKDLYADPSCRVVDIAPMGSVDNHLSGICN
jgi:HD-GYP domain-containing protein (c-di-GMP phosphodiesterase class II)